MAAHIVLLEQDNRNFIGVVKNIDERTSYSTIQAIRDAIGDHFDLPADDLTVNADDIITWSNAAYIDDKIKFTNTDGDEMLVVVERGYIY